MGRRPEKIACDQVCARCIFIKLFLDTEKVKLFMLQVERFDSSINPLESHLAICVPEHSLPFSVRYVVSKLVSS